MAAKVLRFELVLVHVELYMLKKNFKLKCSGANAVELAMEWHENTWTILLEALQQRSVQPEDVTVIFVFLLLRQVNIELQ